MLVLVLAMLVEVVEAVETVDPAVEVVLVVDEDVVDVVDNDEVTTVGIKDVVVPVEDGVTNCIVTLLLSPAYVAVITVFPMTIPHA